MALVWMGFYKWARNVDKGVKMKLQKFSAGVWGILIFGLVCLFISQPVFADASIIYVDAEAVAGGNGQSWGTAYRYLQDALDETNASGASDYEIWVAQGLYYPDQDSDGDHVGGVVSETFRINYNNVQIYGGFSGTENARTERDWESNLTVLSGDIDHNDTTNTNGIVEDTANLVGENAYHVLFFDGVTNEPITTTTVLDGFVITAGQAAGSPDVNSDKGGGLYCLGAEPGHNCSPTFVHLVFEGNDAVGSGGAIYNDGFHQGKSSPTLNDVTFTHNTAYAGGALYNYGRAYGFSNPTITQSSFTYNQSSGNGGAMVNDGSYHGHSQATLTNVTFTNNSAGNDGGAMFNNGDQGSSSPSLSYVTFTGNAASGGSLGSDGGAMYNYGDNGSSNPILNHVTFENNSADEGGGAMLNHAWEVSGYSNPKLTDVTFTNNSADTGGAMFNEATFDGHASPTLINVGFYGNSAVAGGALENYAYYAYSSPLLVNVVFRGNTATSGGGMRTNGDRGDSTPLLINVTFYDNSATSGGAMYTRSYLGTGDPVLHNVILWGNTATDGAQMYNYSASIHVGYSIIEGGLDGAGIYNSSGSVVDDGGNLNADPEFVNPLTGNLHLQPTSPAIDAGDNEVVPGTVTLDLDHRPRFVDYPPEGGTGNGSSPIVDMGAYELQTETFIFVPFVVK